MQSQSGGCSCVPFCGASQPHGREAARACVRFVCPVVAHRALRTRPSHPSEGGRAALRWAHGAGAAAGAALALGFLPAPAAAVLGGPLAASTARGSSVGADRRTALCENGFESPGLCHFKLACNGFPWEEGGVLPPVSPRSL